MNEQIILWGDSIGKGVIYNESRGRYCLAKERCTVLLQRAGLNIDNNAQMGQTISEGLEQFRAAAAQPGSVTVIEYGGNDCDLDWDAVAAEPAVFHNGKTPLPLFRQALRSFITEARQRGQRPVAVIPPPLESERYYRWVCRGRDPQRILSYLGDVHHIYRWHERYANAVREAAYELCCPVIDLRTPFLDARDLPGLICLDGIHPNEDGQRLIAGAVADWLADRGFLPRPFASGYDLGCAKAG